MIVEPEQLFCMYCNGPITAHRDDCKRPKDAAPDTALDTQVGGDHYKSMAIQPVEFIHANRIGYIEGAVIKYVCRWRRKNGVEDLKKARHFLDLLIQLEGVNNGN